MSQDANVRDRIDVRWKVVTRSPISTPRGDAVAEAEFFMTLGTYGGDITAKDMADNINARGVYDGDVVSVSSPGDAVTVAVATEVMHRRGVKEGDIVEMVVAAVMLDDCEIAESVFAQP